MVRKKRSFFVLPLIILAFSVVGGYYGPGVQAAITEPGWEESGLNSDVADFTKFYALVDRNFADPLSPDKAIYKGAIPGMLRTLDPHSYFLDPRDNRVFREEQSGHYFGVGMQVAPRNDKTVVIAPFPGSPAYKAGIRPGDILAAVNDKTTEKLTTSEVADLLKGPRGTPVKIAVSREGAPDYLTFALVRDQIDRKSVPDGFWVKPGVAYIKILSFGETTSHELEENLRRLGDNNIKGLVLDLRGNPGGILNEGVAVAGDFLQRGQAIVSYHGRSAPERVFTARNGSRGRDYPIVVLVNRNSASAAEIVAGALQDHDRAWILGQPTFGKGLVQTVFTLPEKTALALTIAHYYTPSGRLIQRDYSHGSFYDYYFHKEGAAENPNDVKMTDAGRTVYGGGGIAPDEKYDAPPMDRLEADLFRNGLFNFTRSYFVTHPATLPKGWMADKTTLKELHDYLLKNGSHFTEAQFTRDEEWTKRYLTKEMYVYAFNVDESDRVFAMTDPEVMKAVEAIPKAEALVQTAKKAIAQRMGAH